MLKVDGYESEDDILNNETENDSKQSSILNKIISIQQEFYNQNKKNFFFKKNQKIDCAKEICKKMDIYEMIADSIYIMKQTNKIYIDYPIFKLYANPDNFDIIITHIINTCRYLVTYYKNFEVYINLQGLTVSAVERYKDIIKKYVSYCLNENTDFALLMTKLHILNSPSVIEMIVKIVKPIIDPNVVEKVCFYKKEESLQLINTLKKI
jgi:hypothetical protein